MSNTNIQGAFHFSNSRSFGWFPNQSMGWVVASDNSHIEFVAAVICSSKCIGMGLPSRQFWLQQHANSTNGLHCAVSYQAKPVQDIWGAFWRWFLSQDIGRALQDTRHLCQKDKGQETADTVFFKHKYITQPTITQADAIIYAYQTLLFTATSQPTCTKITLQIQDYTI